MDLYSLKHHVFLFLLDLPDLSFNGSTIPLLTMTQKTDIVILNRAEESIFLLELTCNLEQNNNTSNAYKTTKYKMHTLESRS